MENKKMRIVMVEDSADDAELTAFFLNREGLQCNIERVDSRQALELALNSYPPAAILCDLALPSFSGLEALDIAHRIAPATPFLFFSGHTQGPLAEAAQAKGMTKIFSKDNYRHIAALLKQRLVDVSLAVPVS